MNAGGFPLHRPRSCRQCVCNCVGSTPSVHAEIFHSHLYVLFVYLPDPTFTPIEWSTIGLSEAPPPARIGHNLPACSPSVVGSWCLDARTSAHPSHTPGKPDPATVQPFRGVVPIFFRPPVLWEALVFELSTPQWCVPRPSPGRPSRASQRCPPPPPSLPPHRYWPGLAPTGHGPIPRGSRRRPPPAACG